MDRKALSLCAAAATASLGALLSAGCGAGSDSTPSVARKEPRRTATPSAVVVSPAKDFLSTNHRIAPTREVGQPPVSVAQAAATASQPYPKSEPQATQPLDPWAANPAAATESSPVETAVPSADENAPDRDLSTGAVESSSPQSADPQDSMADAETIVPTPAESTDSEIKFAVSGTNPTEDEAAETTITLDVGPGGKKPNKAPIARSPRPVGSKSELTPVFVTPRLAPRAEFAQQGTTPIRDEVAPEPTPAPQEPTLAKPVAPIEVAERTPVREEAIEDQADSHPAAIRIEAQPRKVLEHAVVVAKPAVTPMVEATPQVVEPTAPVAAAPEPIAKSDAIAKSEPVAQAEPVAVIKLVPTPAAAPAPEVEVAAAPVVSSALESQPEPVAVAKKAPAIEQPVAEAPLAEIPTPAIATPVVRQPPKATAPIVAAAPTPAPIAPAPVAAAAPAPIETPAPPPIAATAPSLPQAEMPQFATTRSPAMVATLARADERVRHAIQLAEKGAMYASRKEFTAAISAIAQAHDVEHSTRHYSQAATAGFQALKEAGEFNAAGEVDVRRLVASHKTPILKQFEVSDLPPTLAAQHYYNYAKEQLAIGVGRETVGSIALYGLAKIIIAGAGANAQQLEYTGPAMALYQAALICEPQNFRAAHELGVLLAGSGQLELAREMLMGSVASSPQPVMLNNLAKVHSRLGEQQLAADAQQKADILTQASPNPQTPAVQWVDPATFATMGAKLDPTQPPAAAAKGTTPTDHQPTNAPANVARKRPTSWNPLNLRR